MINKYIRCNATLPYLNGFNIWKLVQPSYLYLALLNINVAVSVLLKLKPLAAKLLVPPETCLSESVIAET